MRADRLEDGLQRSATVTGEWNSRQAGEPRLEELMEDPIMNLIWQRDGLEPISGSRDADGASGHRPRQPGMHLLGSLPSSG